MGNNRYIWLAGEKVYVSEEMYRAYYRPVWREVKQKEVRKDAECSLDALKDSGFELASGEALIDEVVTEKLLLDELHAALAELTDDERSLIDAMFYQDKSEREVAVDNGISSIAIHKRKHKVLEKLKKYMKSKNLG